MTSGRVAVNGSLAPPKGDFAWAGLVAASRDPYLGARFRPFPARGERPPLPLHSNTYDPATLETRWQAQWDAAGLYRAPNPGDAGFDAARPKYYVLDMFPYPSGSGLHVGHAVGYVGTDIVARKRRMEGANVLHPMGWDAFGLPAEQYAIQTGVDPRHANRINTDTFRRQLRRIGLSYDWAREIDTSKPEYYRWTQWLFKRLFERGLAYRADVPVWWCEELKTVLANEEVINGRSERGNHPCVRRPLKQWMLKITAYADRLLDDLEGLDWPESIKVQQREWIGKSEGAEVRFDAIGAPVCIRVFTTRPDTLFGATFLVIAPEHPELPKLVSATQRAAVDGYRALAASKSDLERGDDSKAKTGVFTGSFARNPAFSADDERSKIPIFVADYVLASYGTGAIMAVPGQDQRDWDFARAHDLPIRRTVQPPADWKGEAYTGEGPAIHSEFLDGLGVETAKRRMIDWLVERGLGSARTTYKLRDWLFSRQRYWGEPFPLIHLPDGSTVAVDDGELPVELPELADFKPSADGSAPLARAKEWVATTHRASGQAARRDTDTMPGWAGSCWYWLRFMDPHNAAQPYAPAAERYWGPVDLYVGGAAHAVMHLLYARFWHKVFFDLGLVHTREPFQRLFNQGMITAFAYQDATARLVASDDVEARGERWVRRSTGEPLSQIVTKMAKSLRNVVNPDDVIAEHGADTFRLYEMFMGPLADSKPWNTRDIPGCRRFLDRVWRLYVDEKSDAPLRPSLALDQQREERSSDNVLIERALQRALTRVDDSFRQLNFNTAIAAMMELLNEIQPRQAAFDRGQATRFAAMLAPFAPHIAEELWSRLGHSGSVHRSAWPKPDPRWLEQAEVEWPVQVQGKVRARVTLAKSADEAAVLAAARASVETWLRDKQIVKSVVVPGKLVNFVVR